MWRALGVIAVLAAMVVPIHGPAAGAQTAVGGPVILGGDDLTAHGSFNTSTNVNVAGWLYIQKSLENIKARVTRQNDNSVAALGSAASTATSGNAGAAVGRAAAAAGLTVTYYNGGASILQFFTDLRGGLARPSIIWIAGTDASNDLADSSGAEAQALIDNATTLADFVNSGGGLMSHGTEYRWLSGLLPGATKVNSGGTNDLELTPEGQAAFPGLTNADVNAGPWHNHFAGNLGGLAVLVRSNTLRDAAGNLAAVVIGGAAVQLPGSIVLDPATATNLPGTTHTVTATVRGDTGAVASGVTVTFTVTAGPNAGRTGSAVTNAAGQAAFTYTGSGGTGVDSISASFTNAAGMVRTATASKTWSASATTTTSTTVVSTTTTTVAARTGICNAGDGGAGGTGTGLGGNAAADGGSGAGGTASGGSGSGTGGAGGAGGGACNVIVPPPPGPPPPIVPLGLPVPTTLVPAPAPIVTAGLLARTGAELKRSATLALYVGMLGLLLYAASYLRTHVAPARPPLPPSRGTSRRTGGPLDGPALDALDDLDRAGGDSG